MVALINRRDEHHAWVTDQLRLIVPPLKTCEAVVAEALHLLERRTGITQALRTMLQRGFLDLRFSLQDELPLVLGLMDRYSNVPMSLADACLVRMSEMDRHATLLTIDGDFRIYRLHGREALPLIVPAAI